MANPTIVVTAGAADANSYCTRAIADAYHLARVPVAATWADATNEAKDRALITATRLLDALFEWSGWSASGTQALLWPRTGLLKRNRIASLPSTEIPTELQHACAEFARQLLVSDRTADAASSDLSTQGIKSITAGPISVEYDTAASSSSTASTSSANTVPDIVASMLPPEWGYVRGTRATVDLVRC